MSQMTQAGTVPEWTLGWRLQRALLHDIGIDATLHNARHRFGTQLYQSSGRDLRLTQELLGHADPATTAGYAAYDRAGAADAVAALATPRRLRSVK